MKTIGKGAVLAAGIATLLLLGCGGKKAPQEAPKATGFELADAGFQTPESVLHDPVADVYLVSNINGSPLVEDDNGFISRVSPEGKLLELKWIDGAAEGVTLNAPKGMAIVGDVLYVSDIHVVRKFDRANGAPLGETAIEGATFVNDLAPGSDGSVYATDSGFRAGESGFEPSGTDAVYRITPGGEVTMIARGAGLAGPNGVLETPEGVVVVPFGGKEVYRLGSGGAKEVLGEAPGGSLDGIVRTRDGRLVFSSWETSSVYAMAPDRTISLLRADLPAPADIGYDAKRDLILVPLFNDNKVITFPAGSKTEG